MCYPLIFYRNEIMSGAKGPNTKKEKTDGMIKE
jgi:hypothetical protein